MNADIAEAAKAHPELEFVYADAQQDNAKQVADVETFLRQKIDLLIISPNEAKPLTAVVKRTFESKIPVIVLSRSVAQRLFRDALSEGGASHDCQ